jgi:phosphoribosylformylglycinamidine cyclo-ligase
VVLVAVLVSGTDGVGTKLMIAIQTDTHDTIGIDCVAMCVNDIVAQGAEPLYFLDYIATGKNVPERLEKVVAGVADGCIQAGAALIGGETAEMPGMYDENDYDLAGFAVGIAEKSQLVTGEKIQAGDVLIGLPSSGVHSNGFSLVRKIFFEQHQLTYDAQLPELSQTLGKELLTPTRIYVQAILPLVKEELVHGIAHVTGGGFVENLPRMLPDGLAIKIQENSWPILPIFDVLSSYGNLPTHEMYEIFNMGIGMVVAVAPENVTKVQTLLKKHDEASYIIGKVIDQGEQPIVFNEVEA